MADVTVTPLVPKAAGAAVGFTSLNAADNFKVVNNGRMMLWLKETGASTANVTIATPTTVGGLAVADQVIALTSNQEKAAGPFPRSVYGDELDITCDGTNVDLEAVQL